jgi:hypothetical protein
MKDPDQRPGPDVLLEHPYCVAAAEDGVNISEWAQSIMDIYNAD